MRPALALGLALICAACGQDSAPAGTSGEESATVVAPAAAATPFAKGRYAPRDDCGAIEGAAAFRTQLAEAVRLRDADVVAGLAADDVMLDYGGGAGAAELKARLNEPEGELWQALDELLTLGCAPDAESGIALPWLFNQDLGDADPFETMLVLGEDVPVYAALDGGRRKGAISWDLVTLTSYDPEQPRQAVELPDGTAGFIESAKLRSLVDYRLIAERPGGRWRITYLIAGD